MATSRCFLGRAIDPTVADIVPGKFRFEYMLASRLASVKSLGTPFSKLSIAPSPSRSRGLFGSTVVKYSASAMSNGSCVLAKFALSSSCVLKIQKGDITRWFVDGTFDAIVNPANERMLGGDGADGAIHSTAGSELREACYKIPEVRRGVRCPVGEARITQGFKLPCSHVIHTVGPIYDIDRNPQASLKNAYRNSFQVAKENNIQYIAFTAISCGVYRYPYDEAATIALTSAKEFANDFKEVHFVLFVDEIYYTWVHKAHKLL